MCLHVDERGRQGRACWIIYLTHDDALHLSAPLVYRRQEKRERELLSVRVHTQCMCVCIILPVAVVPLVVGKDGRCALFQLFLPISFIFKAFNFGPGSLIFPSSSSRLSLWSRHTHTQQKSFFFQHNLYIPVRDGYITPDVTPNKKTKKTRRLMWCCPALNRHHLLRIVK